MVAIQCDAVARKDDRPMTVHEAPRVPHVQTNLFQWNVSVETESNSQFSTVITSCSDCSDISPHLASNRSLNFGRHVVEAQSMHRKRYAKFFLLGHHPLRQANRAKKVPSQARAKRRMFLLEDYPLVI